MKLQLIGIVHRGSPNRERIHLRVVANTDLKYFVILHTMYTSPQAISSAAKHTFWFPPTPVTAGDEVILFTGSGTGRVEAGSTGGMRHIYYWGLPNVFFGTTGECAVVFELNTWQSSPYE